MKSKINITMLRYFFSYLAIFLVLLIGFFFILRINLTKVFTEHHGAQTAYYLETAVNQFNNEIDSLYSINSAMLSNISMILVKYDEARFSSVIPQELQKYVIGKNYISSIVYIDKNHDNMYCYGKKYHTTYKDGIVKMVNANKVQFIFDYTYYISNTYGRLIYLKDNAEYCLIYYPPNLKGSNYVSFFVLDINEIRTLCRNLLSDDTIAAAFISPNGDIITGENTGLLLPHVSYTTQESGIVPIDNELSLCISSEAFSGYKIITLNKNTTLISKIDISFRYSLTTLAVLSLFGLILVFLGTVITYSPIHKLALKVTSSNKLSGNIINTLDLAVTQEKQKNEYLESKINAYRLSIQKSILNSLILSNNNSNSEPLLNLDSFFSMDSENYIIVLIVQADDNVLDSDSIISMFPENTRKGNNTFALIENTKNTLSFLINYTVTSPASEKTNFFKQLAHDIYQKTGLTTSISSYSISPLDIPSLYEEAQLAASYHNAPGVIFWDDVKDSISKNKNMLYYPHQLLLDFSNSLNKHNFIKAFSQLDSLFNIIDRAYLVEGNVPDIFARSILIDMLSEIANRMNKINVKFKLYKDLYFETLYYCRSCSYPEYSIKIKENFKKLLTFFNWSKFPFHLLQVY